jgi:hypothetical protein
VEASPGMVQDTPRSLSPLVLLTVALTETCPKNVPPSHGKTPTSCATSTRAELKLGTDDSETLTSGQMARKPRL